MPAAGTPVVLRHRRERVPRLAVALVVAPHAPRGDPVVVACRSFWPVTALPPGCFQRTGAAAAFLLRMPRRPPRRDRHRFVLPMTVLRPMLLCRGDGGRDGKACTQPSKRAATVGALPGTCVSGLHPERPAALAHGGGDHGRRSVRRDPALRITLFFAEAARPRWRLDGGDRHLRRSRAPSSSSGAAARTSRVSGSAGGYRQRQPGSGPPGRGSHAIT